jgi:16S rRNA (adenine1518-N6/adenine1519-N6)-dimethyltransferase
MPRRAGGLPPVRKSLGQHFLTDRGILSRIVDGLAAGKDETVVEIGPGRGALTDVLRERVGRVVAIEIDKALASMLMSRYAGDQRVRIIQADVLSTDLSQAAGGPFALVGNVPYNITTPIIFHALKRPRARRMVFMVQREVADRMQAKPGGGDFGALSVNLQAVAAVRTLFSVPAGAFHPKPKVSSAVVELVPLEHPVVTSDEEAPFREFVQAVFGMRRKQMKRTIRSIVPASREGAEELLKSCEIDPESRPETLAVEQLVRLFRATKTGY